MHKSLRLLTDEEKNTTLNVKSVKITLDFGERLKGKSPITHKDFSNVLREFHLDFEKTVLGDYLMS